MTEINPDESRTSEPQLDTVNMDDPADIQRGYFRKPSFFADIALSVAFNTFDTAVRTSSNYSGWTATWQSRIKDKQYDRLVQVAQSISSRFPINFEAIRDFLIILCCVNKEEDMIKIADAVGIDSLYDPTIIRNVDVILELPDLYKVAFVANAVDGIIKLFSRYLAARSNTPTGAGMSVDKLFSLLGSGSLSAGAAMRLNAAESTNALGQFMSELLTGKRIPMTMIAKNPNLQAPSYIGQAFMGESPIALPNIDITQTFAKKIASFPMPANGSGSTSFSFQNSASMTKSMSIDDLASRILFGSTASGSSTKLNMINDAVNKLNVLTGVISGEKIEPSRADTGIPLMAALSAVQSGTDKPIFSTEVFQEGWKLACAVSNHLAKVDNNYLTAYQQLT